MSCCSPVSGPAADPAGSYSRQNALAYPVTLELQDSPKRRTSGDYCHSSVEEESSLAERLGGDGHRPWVQAS